MGELLEKDKNRKNQLYEFSNNKIRELKGTKLLNKLENEIKLYELKKLCLRLETLKIK